MAKHTMVNHWEREHTPYKNGISRKPALAMVSVFSFSTGTSILSDENIPGQGHYDPVCFFCCKGFELRFNSVCPS
jgi:hypothetical protein